MKDSVNKIISINYNEIDKLELNLNEKTGVTVLLDNIKYELIVHITDFDEDIIVYCPKQLNHHQKQEYKNKAYFENHKYCKHVKHNTIYFHDPTRYSNHYIGSGAGIGNHSTWHLYNISKIIKSLANIIRQKDDESVACYDNLYFYGQSMGAFMAMELSVMIEGTTAIIVKPVFDIKNTGFWPGIKTTCFKNLSDANINNYQERYNIITLIKQKDYIPNVYMILDADDKNDWKEQYNYFLDEIANLNYLHNRANNKISMEFGAIVNGQSQVYHQIINNKIDEIIYLENRKKLFDPIKLHMLTEFEEEIDTYYEKYKNNELIFEEFIDLKNEYTKLWQLGRIDAKNIANEESKIELIRENNKTSIVYPEWYKNEEGEGALIFSKENHMRFKLKTFEDGTLKLHFRGNDYLNEHNIRRKIYTTITKLKIDNQLIINKDIQIWHNEPYIYEISAKNNQIFELEIEYKTIADYYPHIKELIKQMDTNEEDLEKTYQKFKSHVKYLKMINTHI